MAAIIFGIACGGIGLLLVNDCNNKRKNSKIIKKLKKEMKRLELNILKKIRNIEDVELKNIMINAEIDEYKYKTKCYCRIFENGVELYEDGISYQISGIWNDWNIAKYEFKNNLKMKLMEGEFYDILHNQKLNKIKKLFGEVSYDTKAEMFKYYEEYIVYSKYQKNMRLLKAKNRALDHNNIGRGAFLRLDVPPEPEAFEESVAGGRPPRKVMGLFY